MSFFINTAYVCTKETSLQQEGEEIVESKSFSMSIMFGLIAIFLLAIISSFIISLILKFTSVQETSLQLIVTIISFLSIFIGGFISGGKGKQKGWLLGALTGGLYTLIIFLFQYLGYDQLFSMKQIIFHSGYIGVAIIGGIIGVNVVKKSSPTSF